MQTTTALVSKIRYVLSPLNFRALSRNNSDALHLQRLTNVNARTAHVLSICVKTVSRVLSVVSINYGGTIMQITIGQTSADSRVFVLLELPLTICGV